MYIFLDVGKELHEFLAKLQGQLGGWFWVYSRNPAGVLLAVLG